MPPDDFAAADTDDADADDADADADDADAADADAADADAGERMFEEAIASRQPTGELTPEQELAFMQQLDAAIEADQPDSTVTRDQHLAFLNLMLAEGILTQSEYDSEREQLRTDD